MVTVASCEVVTVDDTQPELPRHALVVGHGRSGSNWVLSMLNASPEVHARNEPHLLEGSPYPSLPSAEETVAAPEEMARSWAAFIRWSCERDGERDPRSPVPKAFQHPWATRTAAADWPVRPRIRRALGVVSPELRRAEWRPRRWLVDRSAHHRALHVLKVNDLRSWHAAWVLGQHPQVPVVHLVRHPGGYLRSAQSRFFSTLDDTGRRSEEHVYRSALAASMAVAPRWRHRIGDPSRLSLDEAVMWFWRVNNEEIHDAGKDRSTYRWIRYEDVVAEPLAIARELYDHIGVRWDEAASDAVRAGLGQSVWGPLSSSKQDLAQGWRHALEPGQRELVDQVLADGPMSSWW